MKNLFHIIVLLTGVLGFSQSPPTIGIESNANAANDYFNASNTPCTQVVPSTGELGFGVNHEPFVMADNFNVNAGETATLNTLIINIISADTVDLASADIKIHMNSGGFPGAVLEFFDDLVPTDQILLEDFPNDFSLLQLTFDLSSANVALNGGANGEKYWIAINTTAETGIENQFWEATSTIINEQGLFSLDGGATWLLLASAGIDYEFVMTVEAECLLSNSDFTSSALRLSPNPTTGIISFNGLSNNLGIVEIYDVTGSLVKKQYVENDSIDISDLISGIYFIQVEMENAVFVEKVIKI